jgi:hypothetical protein
MWQVVSGTANLLSDCDLQAIAGDGKTVSATRGMVTRRSDQPRSGAAINAAVEVIGDRWLPVLRDVMFGNTSATCRNDPKRDRLEHPRRPPPAAGR